MTSGTPFRRIKAFTLIELLVVIAIILILISIALPNFLEAQLRAKVARVTADLRTITTALETYYIDWGTYPDDSEDEFDADD
ncbi:MAG: prepilin-type N-terminal cleavage/methylation domain-containing protein, partial [Candidatus Omnitrophica bacterium]|nr:prepilin-type N-terminal cleavage/methylation domain-containing protein [Candidatus Omnitrophota bacterium]